MIRTLALILVGTALLAAPLGPSLAHDGHDHGGAAPSPAPSGDAPPADDAPPPPDAPAPSAEPEPPAPSPAPSAQPEPPAPPAPTAQPPAPPAPPSDPNPPAGPSQDLREASKALSSLAGKAYGIVMTWCGALDTRDSNAGYSITHNLYSLWFEARLFAYQVKIARASLDPARKRFLRVERLALRVDEGLAAAEGAPRGIRGVCRRVPDRVKTAWSKTKAALDRARHLLNGPGSSPLPPAPPPDLPPVGGSAPMR